MTCQIKCRVLDLEILISGAKMFGTEKRGLWKTAHHKLSPLTHETNNFPLEVRAIQFTSGSMLLISDEEKVF